MSDPDYMTLHEEACERGETIYNDPETGYVVFTRLGLLARGGCCGSGCRHCPFDHEKVPLERRARRIQRAAWLSDARPIEGDAAGEPVILFWSGGKDSYLAHRALKRAGHEPIVLLTAFDAKRRIIEHQEIAIEDVMAQARALGAPLIGVPLHPGADYLEQIVPALDLVPRSARLAFGDLNSEPIRAWREETFRDHARTRDMALEFPLWQTDYGALFEDWEASGAGCVISAVSDGLTGVAVGERFDRAFAERLPEGVDPFGANGEFFTRVVLPE